jgi:16S rRNA (guanine966-N2)-methyltransferase
MLRISAGLLKGRMLRSPRAIRPTEGRVRQAIFNILRAVVPGARVLDGYAGSGALGIEALSQGAAHSTFVDHSKQALAAIRINLEQCADQLSPQQYRWLLSDFERATVQLSREGERFDLILLDPPYESGEALQALRCLSNCVILTPHAIVAVEYPARLPLPQQVGQLVCMKQHRYGATVLSFYQQAAA